MDLVKLVPSSLAAIMAVAAGIQQFRVMGLDDALSLVTTERNAVQASLKETRDGLVTSSKRQDSALVDLQAQLRQAQDEIAKGNAELGIMRGRLEASQAATLRMADLAEKLCRKR